MMARDTLDLFADAEDCMKRSPTVVFVSFLLVLSGVVLFGSVPASSGSCPELVGRVPYGPSRAVDAVGDFAYYSSGSMLMIADVANPAAPVVVGELQMPDFVQDIMVAGGYAHVVCGYEGYFLVDVSLPSSPVIVGSYATVSYFGWAFAGGVTESGNLVLVADGAPGLTILDVSQPDQVEYVSEVIALNSNYVEVRGSQVFLTGYDGLRIVDITNPTVPVIVGSAPGGPDGLGGFAVVGNYLYAIGYSDGLKIYDISVPTAPVEVNAIAPPVSGDVIESNGLLFVSVGNELSVFELTDPTAPGNLGAADLGAGRIAVSGTNVYGACHQDGLQVVDVSDPTDPVETGSIPAIGWTLSIAASESLMFAPGKTSEIRAFDTSNPSNPVQISVTETEGPEWDLEVAGDVLFVATGSAFRRIDISNPYMPVEIGAHGNGAHGMEISGDDLYLAASGRLEIFDISNPASPLFRGRVTLPVDASKVAVTNDHAYVSVVGHGLQIVDVSDPTHPTVVGEYGGGEYFKDVAASGAHVFVASFDGLHILDVTVPEAPVRIALWDIDGSVSAVDVSGIYVYFGGDPLTVLDVTDPSHPIPFGRMDPMLAPGAPEQVKVIGDMVYLAHFIGGVSIVRGCHAIFVDGFESGDTTAWFAADAL